MNLLVALIEEVRKANGQPLPDDLTRILTLVFNAEYKVWHCAEPNCDAEVAERRDKDTRLAGYFNPKCAHPEGTFYYCHKHRENHFKTCKWNESIWRAVRG